MYHDIPQDATRTIICFRTVIFDVESMADSGWGIWGKFPPPPPPPPFKKLHTRSRYSNRAADYSNKAVTMFMRQCIAYL